MPANILLVEDEPAIQELIAFNLEQAGHHVLRADTAEQGLSLVKNALPDLVLLDWMLPGVSGIDFTRRLRSDERTKTVPIIMLTARSEEPDKIAGLESGADDYITKPFSPREVVARLKAVLRRSQGVTIADELSLGDVVLNRDSRQCLVAGREVALTATEFDLLAHLMAKPGRVFTREQLLSEVWGYSSVVTTRTVDVHVAQLRAKLGVPDLIRTVRGVGYSADPTAASIDQRAGEGDTRSGTGGD